MTTRHVLPVLGMIVAGCLPPAPSSSVPSTQTEGQTTSSSTTTTSASVPSGAPEGGYPIELLAGPGTGPSLYRGSGSSDPAIGYVSEGVAVEVTGPPEGDRIPVRIRGGLKVRGYLVAQRLYARVQRRGRIRGTPIYVAGNDLVRVVGFEADGRVRVAVRAGNNADALGENFVGTYPVAGLGSSLVSPSDGTTPPGTPCVLGGSGRVEVRESADGPVIGTFPAGTPCRNVREENGVFAVLVGTGPYLAGYVSAAPSPASAPRASSTRLTSLGGTTLPSRLRADTTHTLVRVAPGTRVRFDDTTIAMLDIEGRGRVLERYSDTNEADVFIAVDDNVAVRGMVPLDAITAVSP